MIKKTGSGLTLVPHKLNNGTIQFEGYDEDKQHLFTFTLGQDDDEETQDSRVLKMRTSSEFTGDGDDPSFSMSHALTGD